jgi:signal transduction histidine kinase/ActR/RegA family two-component response regulator
MGGMVCRHLLIIRAWRRWCVCALPATAALLLHSVRLDAAEPGPPPIAVLLSQPRGDGWEDGIVAGLLDATRGSARVHGIHLDAAGDDAVATILALRPRVVLAVDAPAWQRVLAGRARLPADLPLIACGLERWPDGQRAPGTTGLIAPPDAAGTLALALAVQPGVRRIHVLARPHGAAGGDALLGALAAAAGGRELRLLAADAAPALQAGSDAVLVLDGPADAIALGPALTWGARDAQLGHGIVGGSLVESQRHGRDAGALVLRVLNGELPDAIPVQASTATRRVVDAGILQRRGLDPDDVPAGIEIANHQPSFWRQRGLLVLGIVALFAVQAATIAGLLVALRRRREAELSLRQRSRMDAVGQLAAGVAHDFNNVLTAILGHADLLSLRPGSHDEVRAHARTIASAAQRAAGTVRNLLAFARGRDATSSACEANRLVQEVVSLLQHGLDRRIAIESTLDPAVGGVRIGADGLQQVLINLALNARDAMPQGGKLRIATRRAATGETGGLGLPAGDYALVEVADTGSGIAPEHLERIFDPFFTTKELGKGTGLGLAVVHGLVNGSGGAIRVTSRPDEGTRFRIWLPTAGRASSSSVQAAQPASAPRVLLVDDEPVVLDVIGQLLEACGARVHQFDSPTAASAWFSGHPNDVDLAMLDGNMPELAGWQLARRLREARPGLRIVAMTGAATTEARAAWQAAGVSELLHKPVRRDRLLAVLASGAKPAPPEDDLGL